MSGHDHNHDHNHSEQGHDHSHSMSDNPDFKWLSLGLGLLVIYMIIESTIGFVINSIALISDAGHMLTDALSIVLALIAIKLVARPETNKYTFGLKRAEIFSGLINGITLLVLAGIFVVEAIGKFLNPSPVPGKIVVFTAAAGIVVNIIVGVLISKANRTSLNVEGAYKHIINDLYGFIGTLIAGLVMMFFNFPYADAIASLFIAGLMIKAGLSLVWRATRVLLEAAPEGLDPEKIGSELTAINGVKEVHDLHVWTIYSGNISLSAHIVATNEARTRIEEYLKEQYGITHTVLQIENEEDLEDEHLHGAHGKVFKA